MVTKIFKRVREIIARSEDEGKRLAAIKSSLGQYWPEEPGEYKDCVTLAAKEGDNLILHYLVESGFHVFEQHSWYEHAICQTLRHLTAQDYPADEDSLASGSDAGDQHRWNIETLAILLDHLRSIEQYQLGSQVSEAFALAALNGDEEFFHVLHRFPLVVKLCLSYRRARDGKSLLHLAIIGGNRSICRTLIEEGADVHAYDSNQFPPVLDIIEYREDEELNDLFEPKLLQPPHRGSSMFWALNEFEASIIMFSKNATPQYSKKSVYEVLFNNPRSRKTIETHPCSTASKVQSRGPTTVPKTGLQWVNLPANNRIWARDLITAFCIEKSALYHDSTHRIAEVYASLDRTYSHSLLHDRQLKPTCEITAKQTPTSHKLYIDGLLYMPFLSWDYLSRFQTLRALARSRPQIADAMSDTDIGKWECLFSAYDPMDVCLPETHGEHRYPGIDIQVRDSNQVVYRFDAATKGRQLEPRILVVEHLWLWMLPETFISCLSSRRYGSIRTWDTKTYGQVFQGVYHQLELVSIILEHNVGLMNSYPKGDESFKFFEIFEIAVVGLMDKALKAHADFQLRVKRWQQVSRINIRKEQSEQLTQISKETEILTDCLDVEDELNALDKVLEEQMEVVDKFAHDTEASLVSLSQDDNTEHRIRDVRSRLIQDRKDISRLKDQIKNASNIVKQVLEMKLRYANVLEAQFAGEHAEATRKQAEATERQSKILMAFTIVTIVFLPLSFLASFFALDPTKVPWSHDDLHNLNWAFKYLFGVSGGFSLLVILLAWNMAPLEKYMVKPLQRIFTRSKNRKSSTADDEVPPPVASATNTRSGQSSGTEDVSESHTFLRSRSLAGRLEAGQYHREK